jgi:hypothetical protein
MAMDPLTLRRLKGATSLVHDAIDAAVPAIARAHRGVANTPFVVLERVGPIAAPVAVVRAVHDTVTDGTYRTIRSANRILARLTVCALECAEVALLRARE